MAGIPSGRQQGNIKRFTHSMHRLVWRVEFTLPIIIVSLEIGDLIRDKGFDRLPAKLGDTREVSAFVKVGEFGPSPLAYLLVAHHDFTVLFATGVNGCKTLNRHRSAATDLWENLGIRRALLI